MSGGFYWMLIYEIFSSYLGESFIVIFDYLYFFSGVVCLIDIDFA